jgi:carbon-monoxide dehydrogenase medium subunit
VPADDFFKGLFETALGPGDILTSIHLPVARADSRYGFAELARRHGDYALVGLAASARADGKGLKDVRLAFFGVDATPVRARGAEAALERGEDAVAALGRDLKPDGDVQASAAAKRHLAGVLLGRVAKQLAEPQQLGEPRQLAEPRP